MASFADAQTGGTGNAKVDGRIKTDGLSILAVDASGSLIAWTGASINEAAPVAVRVWDMDQKKTITRAVGHAGAVKMIAVENNGRRLVTAGEDKTLRLWSIETGKELFRFPAHEGAVSSLTISEDGKYLVTGSAAKEARVWDLDKRTELFRLEGHTAGQLAVAAARGRVLTGSGQKDGKDYAMRLWNLKDGKEILRLEGHTERITSVALSLNGRWALSGSDDGTARLWDVETGKELRRLTGHKGAIQVKFAPNSVLALTLADQRVRLWQSESGRLIETLATGNEKEASQVAAAVFFQNQVISAGDQTLQIWNVMPSINQQSGFIPKIVSGVISIEQQGRSIVGLTTPSEPKTVPPGVELPILFRECFRQALLIAAREELGLETRDAVLGETIASDKKAAAEFAIHSTPNGLTLELTLVGEGATPKILWSKRYPTNQMSLKSVAALAEQCAREHFPDALKKAGFNAKGEPKRSKAVLPEEIKKRLTEMTLTSQFAALRELHAALRRDGESSELLGGLVRAYANLGLLTEVNWSPAHRAFKARSLLYAERMAVRNPETAWSLWHRAYAEALSGDHSSAVQHLAAAQKPGAEVAAPPWVEMLDAYCHFRSARLAGMANGDEKALAGLLHYLTHEHISSNVDLIKVGIAYAETNPECYRVLDSMSGYGGLGYSQVGSVRASQILNKTLYDRLTEMPQFPKDASKLLKAAAEHPVQGESALLKAMRDAPADGEASWGILADLIQQTRFLHAWRRLEFLYHLLSVPVDQDFVNEVLPLVGDHPYRAFLEHYGKNDARSRDNLRQFLATVRVSEIEPMTQGRLWVAIQTFDPARASSILARAIRHQDVLYRDQLGVAKRAQIPAQMNLQLLRAVSPHSPAAQAEVIRHAWSLAEKSADAWEKEGHPLVLSALGVHYFRAGLREKGERCLETAIRIGADRGAYITLANHYAAQKDEAKWAKTMEASLRLGDFGLATAKTRVQIAEYYMKKKEWKTALPHAEEAAQTGAAWAMICASECNHALENWDKSEALIATTAARYELQRFDWYFWCKYTGRGKENDAKNLAEAYIRSWQGKPPNNRDLGRSAMFYLLSNQHAQAMAVFQRAAKISNDERIRMYLAMAADRNGDKKLRDDTLRTFEKQPGPLADVAREFQKVLSGESAKLDLIAIGKAVKAMSPGLKPEGTLYVGMFLIQHGQGKDAPPYLEHAHQPQIDITRAIAASLLRELTKQ